MGCSRTVGRKKGRECLLNSTPKSPTLFQEGPALKHQGLGERKQRGWREEPASAGMDWATAPAKSREEGGGGREQRATGGGGGGVVDESPSFGNSPGDASNLGPDTLAVPFLWSLFCSLPCHLPVRDHRCSLHLQLLSISN